MSAQRNAEDNVDLSLQEIFKDRLFEPDEDPKTFHNQLIGIADSFGEDTYYKKFNESELARFKETVVGHTIEIQELEAEKKDVVKSFDEQLKPLKETRSRLATEIKAGHTWVTETVYKVVDETSGMVAIYDPQGVLQSIEKMKRGRGLQKTIALKSNLD